MTDLQAAARQVLACLDLTELGDDCSEAHIDDLCQKAVGAPTNITMAAIPFVASIPFVAAVCVWPRWVARARSQLPPAVRVAAVVNFPHGRGDERSVLAEVAQIAEQGGQEVDCVLPYHAWQITQQPQAQAQALHLLRAVRRASAGLQLKVILESGVLPSEKAVAAASHAALDAGADFIKTSTGKVPQGASLDAARTMLNALAERQRHWSGEGSAVFGFKPSGGLRRVVDAMPYLALTEQILGPGAVQPQRFRIGASGLWQDAVNILAPSAESPPLSASSNY